MKTFIFIVLSVCCLPFAGVGLYEIYEIEREAASSAHAVGTVSGNSYQQTNIDGNVSGAYHPVVEFTGANGEKIRFTDGVGSLPQDYEPGAAVEVVYSRQQPEKARIYSWKRIWLAPSIFIAVGLLPLAVAAVIMRRLKF
ncbi:MAG TPA: DUF3592 domain-containing protein [Pyrinomonadaceae bacterium]|jgi:hypothetical protein